MKKKIVAVSTIFFTFFGFAWIIESKDRFTRGIIETEDPASINIESVKYDQSEEVDGDALTKGMYYRKEPFKSREYIRVIPNSSPQVKEHP